MQRRQRLSRRKRQKMPNQSKAAQPCCSWLLALHCRCLKNFTLPLKTVICLKIAQSTLQCVIFIGASETVLVQICVVGLYAYWDCVHFLVQPSDFLLLLLPVLHQCIALFRVYLSVVYPCCSDDSSSSSEDEAEEEVKAEPQAENSNAVAEVSGVR